MRRPSAIAFVALLSVALAASAASALSLPSKNKKGSVCSAGWEVTGDSLVQLKNAPGNHKLDCADGSDCDADGEVNGSCTVTLTACAAPAVDGCTPQAVTEFKFAPKKKVDLLRSAGFGDPPTGVTEQACGTPGTVVLATRPKKNGTVKPSKPFKAVMKFKDAGKGISKVLVRCIEGSGGGTTTTTIPVVGNTCPDRGPGLPKQASYTVPIAPSGESNGSDLDNGWTGQSHNFPTVSGSTLTYCLNNCDATTDSLCEGSVGPVGEDSINGRTFGAPLPLLAANVPVCVVNVFQESITADIDLATGEAGNGLVKLFAETYTPTPFTEICPRCNSNGGIGSTGTCSSSAKRSGQSCVVEGVVRVAESGGNKDYKLSGDCLPSATLAGTLDIQLPLTTGTSSIEGSRPCRGAGGLSPQNDACTGGGSCTAPCTGPATCPTKDAQGNCIDAKGGISQTCCSNDGNKSCLPSDPDSGGLISRTGIAVVAQPAWPDPTYPKTATGNLFAAVFCEGATGSSQVNLVTGLPGPGALLLPGDVTITASE